MDFMTVIFMCFSILSYLPFIWGDPATIHENLHVYVARLLGDKTAHIVDGKATSTSLTGKKKWVAALSPYLIGLLPANVLGIALVFRSSPSCFIFLEIILVALVLVGIINSPGDRWTILHIR